MKEHEKAMYENLINTLKELDMESLLILRAGAEMLRARQNMENPNNAA